MNTEIELISQKNEDERREQAKKATMGMNGRLSGILLQYTSNDYYKSLSLKRNETKKKNFNNFTYGPFSDDFRFRFFGSEQIDEFQR